MFTVYTRALVQAPWYTRKISQAIMLAQQPCITLLMIYHDGSNNVVQVCSFFKPGTVCSNMLEKVYEQPSSSSF